MSRMSQPNAIENDLPPSPVPDDVDWDAPQGPDPTLAHGDDETLVRRIRKHAADPAVPYEARCTLYLAAARIEWLAGQGPAK